jgi:hypothetical protein
LVEYAEAERLILNWQLRFQPNRTLIFLDQPTIVANQAGPSAQSRTSYHPPSAFACAAGQPVTHRNVR